MEITVFTHDGIKGTDGYSTTNVLQLFLLGVRLWHNALSLAVYNEEMFESHFINICQTNWRKTHCDGNNQKFSESYMVFQFR